MEEAAKLAFNLDYGEEMQRHVEKIVELSEWFEWILETRINHALITNNRPTYNSNARSCTINT